MARFTVDIDSVAGTSIVMLRCHGDIDAHTCAGLDDAMKGVLEGGVKQVIVDLTDVPYTASRGLGVLIAARKQLEDRDGGMALLNPNDTVKAAIEVLGFDSVFSIASTVEDAVQAVSG